MENPEARCKDFKALKTFRTSKQYVNEALVDERTFIDHKHADWLVTRDCLIFDDPVVKGQLKTVTLLQKENGSSVKTLREYGVDIHGTKACDLPGIERYVQSPTIDEAY